MKAANIETRVWARLTARAVSGVESHAPLNDGLGREPSPTRSRYRYVLLTLVAVAFGLGLIAGSISSLSLLQTPENASVEIPNLAPQAVALGAPGTESNNAEPHNVELQDTAPETETTSAEAQQNRAKAIKATIEEWTRAWSDKNVERYLDHYSARFEPPSGQTLEAWKAQRHERLTRSGEIEVEIFDLEIEPLTPARVIAHFDQTFASPRYRDRVKKTLELVKEDQHWKIFREEARSLQPST